MIVVVLTIFEAVEMAGRDKISKPYRMPVAELPESRLAAIDTPECFKNFLSGETGSAPASLAELGAWLESSLPSVHPPRDLFAGGSLLYEDASAPRLYSAGLEANQVLTTISCSTHSNAHTTISAVGLIFFCFLFAYSFYK